MSRSETQPPKNRTLTIRPKTYPQRFALRLVRLDGTGMIVLPNVAGQPRRTGHSVVKKDIIEALCCRAWFASYSLFPTNDRRLIRHFASSSVRN